MTQPWVVRPGKLVSDGIHQPKDSTLANVALTTGDVLAQTRTKIFDELSSDLSPERRGKLALIAGGSTVVGFGTTAMLTKLPKVGSAILLGLAAYQTIRYAANALDFVFDAANADSDYARKLLANRTSSDLARESTFMIESAPCLIAGGALSAKTIGVPFKSPASPLDDKIVAIPRHPAQYAREQWAFYGPGSMRVPSTAISQDGRVNLVEIGELLSERHPWQGVEVGRSIDLLKGRISRPVYGTKRAIEGLGVSEKPGRISFHTHSPDAPIGPRPSLVDLNNERHVGIIARGDDLTLYVGRAREYKAAQAAGREADFAPKLKATVLNKRDETALLLQGKWHPKTERWTDIGVNPVDYQAARKVWSQTDLSKPWSQPSQIAPSFKGVNHYFEALGWMQATH